MQNIASQDKNFNIGPIRPPSEAGSLLLQVTRACTWNRCKFCNLYRGSKFGYATLDEMKANIDLIAYYRDMIKGGKPIDKSDDCFDEQGYYMVYNWLTSGGTSAFLQDANTMVLKPDYLVGLLEYLRGKLPELKRVTSYGRADSLAKISPEDFVRLKKAGLDRIHSGYESGSDQILSLVNKGTTQAMQIEGGKKAIEAGIELSIYFMPGLGGKELSVENAVETAKVINAVNPQFVRLRTTVIKKGTELWDMKESGLYIPSTDLEKVEEILLMLENIQGVNGILKSDHIINLLYEIEGSLDSDLEKMKQFIRDFLALPEREIKRFQLAKRMGRVYFLREMKKLSSAELDRLDRVIDSVNTLASNTIADSDSQNKAQEEWENILSKHSIRYI